MPAIESKSSSELIFQNFTRGLSGHFLSERTSGVCSSPQLICDNPTPFFLVTEAHSVKFANLLNDILLKTRSNKPKIRYRILLFVKRLFDRVGDSIPSHLRMVMPFLSELLEDGNKNVEEQCDQVVPLLQRIFGAELSPGFV
ncbi:unnamed protein product, partial [Mesorhabditis belari]|uniref:HEAT repeat-containing protein 1 n=1 Tax=Mesorhabditis belari TaxID=2138241 RepID=A0AAF3FQK1_9BILA